MPRLRPTMTRSHRRRLIEDMSALDSEDTDPLESADTVLAAVTECWQCGQYVIGYADADTEAARVRAFPCGCLTPRPRD